MFLCGLCWLPWSAFGQDPIVPELARIPEGSFIMGSGKDENNPPHRVEVSSFYIAKTEITVGQWRAFTEAQNVEFPWKAYHFLQWVRRPAGWSIPDNWAMYYVDWYEAIWYANWLSEQHDLEPAYGFDVPAMRRYIYDWERGVMPPDVTWDREASGYRLPTEAEWEYVATEGGSMEQASVEELLQVAWVYENSDGKVKPPGQKPPNSFGVFDILGNVAEWCWDYYQRDYYLTAPVRNPAGPNSGEDAYFGDRQDIRVMRGCDWSTPVEFCAPALRRRTVAAQRTQIGIRLARNAE